MSQVKKNGGLRAQEGQKKGGNSSDITARPYQVELLEDALCENTIVNLGTGAGKTFIAVMLVKELSHEILDKPFTDTAKRTVFLVNTVPLVKQQADYLQTHTMLDIGQYVGAMGVDGWSKDQWLEELSNHHLLVMTHTIFKNLLHGGFIHLKNVNLLVFDECHHAVKNHEYVQIMKVFDSCSSSEYPRVLGLSASLLPNKCKPGELQKQVKELETRLKSRCQTSRDYENVAKYATNPEEETIIYSLSPPPNLRQHTDELRVILSEPLVFLNSLPKAQRDDGCFKVSKTSLDDCLHVLENLGIWCALNCAEQCIEGLKSTLSSDSLLLEPSQKALLGLAITNMSLFVKKAREVYDPTDVDITNKVKKLLSCLTQQLGTRITGSRKRKDMLGIVFVERRMTALLLTRILNALKVNDPRLARIKCAYVVGQNDARMSTTVRRETHMNVNKQHEVLENFRKEKINLLVATSVVEEGIDVPQCNLVIRFDFPPNIRSYIQSKGRARAKPSKYILMIEDEKQGKALTDLRGYQVVEIELRTLCQDRRPPDDEDFLKFLDEQECNIYAPYGLQAGVRATLSSSLSFLYKYCQKFSDKFTSFAPIFEHESRLRQTPPGADLLEQFPDIFSSGDIIEYRSTVQLPISCPIRDKITGHWMPKRSRIADKSAALAAIRELHRRGELDEHLKPVTIDPDSDNDEEEEEKAKDKHAGTERRAKYYPDKVSSSLKDNLPTNVPGNYLYILLMEEADSDIKKFPFSKHPPQGPHYGLGILTQKPLPHKRIPEFSIYEKKMEIRVSVVELSTRVTTMSTAEISLLKQCHRALFESVLKLGSPLLECSFRETSKNILVVPLNVWQMQNPPLAHIDFDMAEKVINVGQPSSLLQWPFPYQDAVVMKAYAREYAAVSDASPREGTAPREGEIFEIIEVNKYITPSHEFPSPPFVSYAEYFTKRYNMCIKDLDQPALECKRIGFSESRLRLITSRFMDTHGVKMDPSSSTQVTENLFAEVTCLYPLPASFVKVIRCLPSMLYRIEMLLSVNDLRLDVTVDTDIGRLSTTIMHLRGYRDYGLGKLESQRDLDSSIPAAVSCPCSECSPNKAMDVRGPGNALLLQAVTLKSANDSIDNERLETLGDSFLKLATSVFLYCDRPDAYEGRLTSARTRRIGNLNLFRLAKHRNMIGKIISKRFNPISGWIPPCFTFTESTYKADRQDNNGACGGVQADNLSDLERQFMYHKVTDKGAADFMESLIGAYLVAGGIEAALGFMKWIGVKITRKNIATETESVEMSEDELKGQSSTESLRTPSSKRRRASTEYDPAYVDDDTNLFIDHSSEILQQHFGPVPPSLFDPANKHVVIKLLKHSTGTLQPHQVQEIVHWKFKDRALLLQALTHASYQKNRVTDCYQRLEFLGDAVLDYLITIQIYERFPQFDPGKITDMRSALVNNNLFAELAVKLKLHKLLLHLSPSLFKLIPQYEEFITKKFDSDHTQDEQSAEDTTASCMPDEAEMDFEESDSDCGDDDDDEDDDDETVEPPKVLGDLLESLAGAIFMDSGMNLKAVWDTFGPLFNEKIEIFKHKIPVPPLKELHQLYPDVKVKIVRAGQGKVCGIVKYHERMVARVIADSKKAAKNSAARAALRNLAASTN